MAAAIIDSADQDPAPLRLVLGSAAQQSLESVLSARLADVEAQALTAGRTDVPVGT